MLERDYERAFCRVLEARAEAVVSRQLGVGATAPARRVMDVVALDPGPNFDSRAAITAGRIPPRVLGADLPLNRSVPLGAAFPDRSTERALDLAERAADCGFLEFDRRSGRPSVRRLARYPPDWFATLRGFELKPSLDRPGDLYAQVQFDASLGVLDEVVVVTGSHVRRGVLHRLPDPVGVWQFDPERHGTGGVGEIVVVRKPQHMDPAEAGIEPSARDGDRRAIDIVTPELKERRRRAIAERAYGKGWRQPGTADRVTERAERSPWVADPPGPRRQVGLSHFTA